MNKFAILIDKKYFRSNLNDLSSLRFKSFCEENNIICDIYVSLNEIIQKQNKYDYIILDDNYLYSFYEQLFKKVKYNKIIVIFTEIRFTPYSAYTINQFNVFLKEILNFKKDIFIYDYIKYEINDLLNLNPIIQIMYYKSNFSFYPLNDYIIPRKTDAIINDFKQYNNSKKSIRLKFDNKQIEKYEDYILSILELKSKFKFKITIFFDFYEKIDKWLDYFKNANVDEIIFNVDVFYPQCKFILNRKIDLDLLYYNLELLSQINISFAPYFKIAPDCETKELFNYNLQEFDKFINQFKSNLMSVFLNIENYNKDNNDLITIEKRYKTKQFIKIVQKYNIKDINVNGVKNVSSF